MIQPTEEIKDSVVKLSLPELCDEVKRGRLKAVDVLRAYQVQVGVQVNICTL